MANVAMTGPRACHQWMSWDGWKSGAGASGPRPRRWTRVVRAASASQATAGRHWPRLALMGRTRTSPAAAALVAR